jgi:hypothetical protein
MTELAKLVGEDSEHLWYSIPYKKLFYKDGEVYGIIGVKPEGTMSVVYSMARNNGEFTIGMLRMIRKLYSKSDIMLITDDKNSFEKIYKTLEPYGFYCFVSTNEYGMEFLYSIHYKE